MEPVYGPPREIAGRQYGVTVNTVSKTFTVAGSGSARYTVQDNSEGGSDDINIIGDIPNDGIIVTPRGFPVILRYAYVGNVPGQNNFLVRSGESSYTLFSDQSYTIGDVVAYETSPVVVCFAAGANIRTHRGEVPVETLVVGDLVVTASGQHRPIRWLGHRTMACQGRKDVMPVRIARHAFGEGRPARDLLVSPGHAICVDLLGGVLIPAIRLVNGTTIQQVEVEEVTYWHVELDSHDILLAEGLPAESYLECGNRHFFANAAVTRLQAAPDARPQDPLRFCRPFHEDGPLVETVRARLEARAKALGWTLVQEPPADLHLVADGRVIRPAMHGMSANFALPADAHAVRLVSKTSAPAHVGAGSTDDRRLGVSIHGLVLDDGVTGARAVALDDPRLDAGFHRVDRDAAGVLWRWTDGSAVLPASLWAGCRGAVSLRVALAAAALPRWIGPGEAANGVEVRRRA